MSKKLVLFTYIVMMLGAITTPSLCEETGVIILPEHACMAKMSEPDSNHDGSQLRVRVGGNDATRTFKSWLKFDVSGIDVLGLESANLVLALEHDRGRYQLDVSYINDDCHDNIDWTTEDLTWNNAPGNLIDNETDLDPNKTTLIGRFEHPTGLPGEQLVIDVLEALKSDTDGIVQLVLHNSSSYLKVASHTHSEEAWRPFLILTGGPGPYDGEIDVSRDAVLGWLAGEHAATYDVYLGTDFNDVNEATIDNPLDVLVSTGQEETTFVPAELLEFKQTYYWRIDDVNDVDPNSPWKGDIWSFTVADFIVVDDFEDYNDWEPDTIYFAWLDGYEDPTNGSTSGYPEPFFSDGEHFVETRVVHKGQQAYPYFYDNTTAPKSEATKTLTSLTDWTQESFVTMRLWYIAGQENNAPEPMYVIINDSAKVVNDDTNAALATEWTEWIIDLQEFIDQGANLASVSSITIGFGDGPPGGSGLVIFDDLRLHNPAP